MNFSGRAAVWPSPRRRADTGTSPDQGKIAVAAGHLVEGVAGAGRCHRDAHLGEHLVHGASVVARYDSNRSAAAIVRGPPAPTTVTEAPKQQRHGGPLGGRVVVGREPPKVPRLRTTAWATSGATSASSGTHHATWVRADAGMGGERPDHQVVAVGHDGRRRPRDPCRPARSAGPAAGPSMAAGSGRRRGSWRPHPRQRARRRHRRRCWDATYRERWRLHPGPPPVEFGERSG